MSLQAFDELGGRRMPNKLDLDTELRPERLRDLHDHGAGPLPLDLTGCGILHELRQMQSDSDLAGACDVGHARVEARLLRIGACRHRRERQRCKQCTMRCCHVSPSASYTTGQFFSSCRPREGGDPYAVSKQM